MPSVIPAQPRTPVPRTMFRGDSDTFSVIIKQGKALMAAAVIDAASFYYTAKAKHSDADADAIFQKTSSDGISIEDADAGKISVTVDPADTLDLPADTETSGWYDIRMKTSDDQIFTIVEGPLLIQRNVLRSPA